jgi:hypothetical protein
MELQPLQQHRQLPQSPLAVVLITKGSFHIHILSDTVMEDTVTAHTAAIIMHTISSPILTTAEGGLTCIIRASCLGTCNSSDVKVIGRAPVAKSRTSLVEMNVLNVTSRAPAFRNLLKAWKQQLVYEPTKILAPPHLILMAPPLLGFVLVVRQLLLARPGTSLQSARLVRALAMVWHSTDFVVPLTNSVCACV